MKRIGIDVGGTNTDAVLLDGETLLASVKTATTPDVMSGIRAALAHLLETGPDALGGLRAIMIGTTHFTNAVVERRALSPVAVIRIGLPAASSIPPLANWPEDLRAALAGPVFLLRGGHEFDGRPIVTFDESGMRAAARAIRESGVSAAAITAVFSPLTAECEKRAAVILAEEAPSVSITLSSALGRIGLIERENATILNSALHQLATRTVSAFEAAIAESGLAVPLFLTQNDGTVMRAEVAARYPVRCFASGPTNSMRGARLLSGLDDAVVLDVGGTTTDAGFLQAGFPRQANTKVDIGGVQTFFAMPDVLAVALGGGTVVRETPLAIGPDSVGYRIGSEARVMGGAGLTLTDIGVAGGAIAFGDPARIADLDPALVEAVRAWIRKRLTELIDRMKISAGDVPVVAVGGGAFLVPDHLPGASSVIKVPHAGVANAIGAAMAQVSGEVDQVFYDLPRAEALERAEEGARAEAVSAGAALETIIVHEVEDTPLAYVPGTPLRVRLRVIGELAA